MIHPLSVLFNLGGPHATKTAHLFWLFFGVEAVIGILVLGFLFISLYLRREPELVSPLQPEAATERRLVHRVSICVALTAFILMSFVVMSYAVDRQLIDLDQNPEVVIEVTAHQWWWEIRYEDSTPSKVFTTANEIHVPIHSKIRMILKSSDVIHSLWFPNLSGKRDIIPGRNQDLFIRVDEPGTWLGRCAEFCGLQHAYMGLTLIAESSADFEIWKDQQRKPASEPESEEQKHGQKVFQTSACALCHSLRTSEGAQSNNAPDLTHLKSRMTIGAGAAPNTKGYLGGWIIDPHGIKPGVHMPTVLQEPRDFQALLSYLEILK